MGRMKSRDFLLKDTVKNVYGKSIEGRRCYLDIVDCSYNKGLAEAYPFKGQTVPVTILLVTDHFISARVEPHLNHTIGMMTFGNSRPYVVTIPKFSLICGAMVLKDTPTGNSLAV